MLFEIGISVANYQFTECCIKGILLKQSQESATISGLNEVIFIKKIQNFSYRLFDAVKNTENYRIEIIDNWLVFSKFRN